MMAFTKSAQEMIVEALDDIQAETRLTQVGSDSVVRSLVASVLSRLALYQEEDASLRMQYNLSTSVGSGLDSIGSLLGPARKPASAGVSSALGIRFYIAAPAGSDITIAAGTQVWSPVNPGIYYLTRTTTVIPTGGTEAFTDLIAPESGAYYTAAPYTLTKHNASAGVPIFCTNTDAVSGSDVEGDSSYMYRLSQARSAQNLVQGDSIRAQMLAFPGVLDATVMSARRGNGTVDVLVYTVEPVPNPATLQKIQSYAEGLVAEGVSLRVIGPTVQTIGLAIRVAFDPSVTSDQYAAIRTEVESSARFFVNTLEIGQDFKPQALITALSVTLAGRGTASIVSMTLGERTVIPDVVIASALTRMIAGRVEVL